MAVWKVGYYDIPESGDYELRIELDEATSVEIPDLPRVTSLRGVHPNPFNPRTTVSYDLAAMGWVKIVIYDVTGARVRTLLDRTETPGQHSVVWDGHDQNGHQVSSGTYIVRMDAGGVKEFRKVALIK